MRRSVSSAVAAAFLALMTAQASAADVPDEAGLPDFPDIQDEIAALDEAETSWSGFYIGALVGYSKSISHTTVDGFRGYEFPTNGAGFNLYGPTPFGDAGSNTLTSSTYTLPHPLAAEGKNDAFDWRFGAMIGAQQQIGSFVVGFEGVLQMGKDSIVASDLYTGTGTATYYNPTANTVSLGAIGTAGNQNIFDTVTGTLTNETLAVSTTIDNQLDARIRMGFLAADRVMIYGMGGFSLTQMRSRADYSATATFESDGGGVGAGAPSPYVTHTTSASAVSSRWHTGFTLGGGIEALLSEHVSLRLEYAYTDHGKAQSQNWMTTNASTGYASAFLPNAAVMNGGVSAAAESQAINMAITYRF